MKYTNITKNTGLILQRTFCIVALLSTFVIIGAPGRGGRGGSRSHSSHRSSSHRSSSSTYRRNNTYRSNGYRTSVFFGSRNSGYRNNRPLTEEEKERNRRTMRIVLGVLGVGAAGGAGWMLYRRRKSNAFLAGATLRLSVVTLLEGNASEHVQFFEHISNETNFSVPLQRAKALNRVLAYIGSASMREGFVQKESLGSAKIASDSAESLARQQIRRVDAPRDADPSAPSSCVVGFTLTTTPDRAERILSGTGRDGVARACQMLSGMDEHSLDAFYLFYAPGPGDILPRSQAEAMVSDLHEIGSSSFAKAA